MRNDKTLVLRGVWLSADNSEKRPKGQLFKWFEEGFIFFQLFIASLKQQ